MARTCSECTFMDFDKEYNCDGRFWCEYKCEYIYANSAECYKFCEAYSRASSVARSYFDYSVGKQNRGGCFITTVVCDILNLNDHTPVLDCLRNFRNHVLQKETKYQEILATYDIIGPMIAQSLKNDSENQILASNLFTMKLIPIARLIDEKEYTTAIKEYTNMTNFLVNRYHIVEMPTQEEIERVDLEKAGHGVYVKKI